jgi:acetolactate synthase-1/2/3 large subunit
MWTAQAFKFDKSRRFVTSGGLGAMGFGLGAAIGASIGAQRSVALITGDGSFHMNMNEVVTAVQLKLPIAIFVFNNNTLGMVRQWQTLFYGKRYSSTTLDRPTDYGLLAKAFGARYMEINEAADAESVVKKALTSKTPVIVNCRIGTDENVLPMIPAGKSAENIIINLKEEQPS